MVHPFKLVKLFGTQLSRHESSDEDGMSIVYTNQLQQPNTVLGLYVTSAVDRSSRTKEFTERLVQFYKEIQQMHSESSPPPRASSSSSSLSSSSARNSVDGAESKITSDSTLSTTSPIYNFHVIMISFDETEKTIIPISKTTKNSTPFLIFNDDEKSKQIQEYLIRKYSVQETPNLILIDGDSGQVINYNGVGKIEGATTIPKNFEFPWRLPSCSEILFSGQLISSTYSSLTNTKMKSTNAMSPSTSGGSISSSKSMTMTVAANPASILKKDGIRGLLFSAYWCPPCKVLVNQLVEVYVKLKRQFKFEIVFVSSDRSQESFDRFITTMPWYAIPFSEEQRRLDLTSILNIKAIPTLILLDSKDNIITTDGRGRLSDDLDAMDFPWQTKLVEELHDRHSSILNHTMCLIYFVGDDDSEYDKAEAILHPIATQITESNIEEAFELKSFIATDSELAESLRLFMDLEESTSYIVILDIPNFRYAIASPTQIYDIKLTTEFIKKFQNSQLKYRYIQSRFI